MGSFLNRFNMSVEPPSYLRYHFPTRMMIRKQTDRATIHRSTASLSLPGCIGGSSSGRGSNVCAGISSSPANISDDRLVIAGTDGCFSCDACCIATAAHSSCLLPDRGALLVRICSSCLLPDRGALLVRICPPHLSPEEGAVATPVRSPDPLLDRGTLLPCLIILVDIDASTSGRRVWRS